MLLGSSSIGALLTEQRAKMALPTKLYTVSSLLMAVLFAVSAFFQFNDLDWYFWIPLYVCGSAVNLISCWSTPKISRNTIQWMAKLSLWLGMFLFIKVIVESVKVGRIWSLDLRERVAREKLGSGLVFVSMILQLAASSVHHLDIQTYLYSGIRVILGVAMLCGVSLVFLVLLTGSMIMHSASSSVQDDPNASWQSKLAKYVDSGTILVIGTNYGLFFGLFLLFFTWMILKPLNSLVPAHKMEDILHSSIGYGMAALVGISYGLSLVFHVYHKDQMKF